jgi:hypothetical protein
MKQLTVLLLACALFSPRMAHAAKPQTVAQAQANLCAILGKMAAFYVSIFERGYSSQSLLDELDSILAKTPRDPDAIARNILFRQIATRIILTPSWSQAQARVSIEMACLRGDYDHP